MFRGSQANAFRPLKNSREAIDALLSLQDKERLNIGEIFSQTAEALASKKQQATVFVSEPQITGTNEQIYAFERFNAIRQFLDRPPLANHYENVAFAADILGQAIQKVLEKNPDEDTQQFLHAFLQNPDINNHDWLSKKKIVTTVFNAVEFARTPIEIYNSLVQEDNALVDSAANHLFAKESLAIAKREAQRNLPHIDPEKIEKYLTIDPLRNASSGKKENTDAEINAALIAALPIPEALSKAPVPIADDNTAYQSLEIYNTLQENLLNYIKKYLQHDSGKADYENFEYREFPYVPLMKSAQNEEKARELLYELTNALNEKLAAIYENYDESLTSTFLEDIVKNELLLPEASDKFNSERRDALEMLSAHFAKNNEAALKQAYSRSEPYVNFLLKRVLPNDVLKIFLSKNTFISLEEKRLLLQNCARIFQQANNAQSVAASAPSTERTTQEQLLQFLANTNRSTEDLFIHIATQLYNTRSVENESDLEFRAITPPLEGTQEEENETQAKDAYVNADVTSDEEDLETEFHKKIVRGKPKQFVQETKDGSEFSDNFQEPQTFSPELPEVPRKKGERIIFDDETQATSADSTKPSRSESMSSTQPSTFDYIKTLVNANKLKNLARQKQEREQYEREKDARSRALGAPVEDASKTQAVDATTLQQDTPSSLVDHLRSSTIPTQDYLTRPIQYSLLDDLLESNDSETITNLPSTPMRILPPVTASPFFDGSHQGTPVHRVTVSEATPPEVIHTEDTVEIQDEEEAKLASTVPSASATATSSQSTASTDKPDSTIRALYNHMTIFANEFLPKPHATKIQLLQTLIETCRAECQSNSKFKVHPSQVSQIMAKEDAELKALEDKVNKSRHVNPIDLDRLEKRILLEAKKYTYWFSENNVSKHIQLLKNEEEYLSENAYLAKIFLKYLPQMFSKYSNKLQTESQTTLGLVMIFKDFFIKTWKNNNPLDLDTFLKNLPLVYAKFHERDPDSDVTSHELELFEKFIKKTWRNGNPASLQSRLANKTASEQEIILDEHEAAQPHYQRLLEIYNELASEKAEQFTRDLLDRVDSSRLITIRSAALHFVDNFRFIYSTVFNSGYKKELFTQCKEDILEIDTSYRDVKLKQNQISHLLNNLMTALHHQVTTRINDDIEDQNNFLQVEKTDDENLRLDAIIKSAVYLNTVEDLAARGKKQGLNVSERLNPLKTEIRNNMQEILHLDLGLADDKEKLPKLIEEIKMKSQKMSAALKEVMEKYRVSITTPQSAQKFGLLTRHYFPEEMKKREAAALKGVVGVAKKKP